MILKAIRTSKKTMRVIASFMAFNLLLSLAAPMQALALTGGPSQPEVQSFEPVSANQMVDPFTGDFTYNIPLLDVGGYPINISYHAGPGLDEEASWVGLGWNINPGVINRNMRGIPDDFNGQDKIKKTLHMKNNVEVELRVKKSKEIFGKEFDGTKKPTDGDKTGFNFSYGIGIKYNNYRGLGYNFLFNGGYTNKKGKGPLSIDAGLSFDNQSGGDLDMSIGRKRKYEKDCDIYLTHESVSIGVNSRAGLKALSIQRNRSKSHIGTYRVRHKHSTNGSAALTFNSPSYTPTSNTDYNTFGLNLSFAKGKYIQGIQLSKKSLGVSVSINGIKNNGNEEEYPAYGFLNNNIAWEKISKKEKALMDFNRDGANKFGEKTKYLSVATSTYDVLYANGQGISGSYRPFYSSVGVAADAYGKSYFNPNMGVGWEFGIPIPPGNTGGFETGVDANLNFNFSSEGVWSNDNAAIQNVNFTKTTSSIDFEPAYYKNIGEKTKNDIDFYNKIGAYNPIAIELGKNYTETKVSTNAKDNNGSDYSLTNLVREKRDKRNQLLSYLSIAEAANYGLVYNTQFSTPALKSNHTATHHIGEYTVTNPNGSRYVYGLPAYNTKQKEVTFNISDGKDDEHSSCDGLVDYGFSDAGSLNTKGIDHYFSAEEVPQYAHSYLLSAVLSPDYIDVNGDGPTEDDFGSYTYIEYDRAHENYKWRTPYTSVEHEANLQRAFMSDNFDDKANYIYGEKEIWYINKIRTKTHIAIFHTSFREDGLEALGENGGKDITNGKTLKKLDKIELFTLEDYNLNGTNATPIKVVNFEYNYSLCPNVPNNTGDIVLVDGANINAKKGKLTLKKIKFSYGKSSLAALSFYEFNYDDDNTASNPYYAGKSYDRWGNYKPNLCALTNDEFPYTLQDDRTTKSDVYAAAWSLREIMLPSGGKIQVDYEADDYAYVQERKAMEMVNVIGAANSGAGTYNNQLYHKKDNYNVLFFNYRNDDPNVTFTKELLKKHYWNDDKYLYYSFNIDLDGGNYEQVNGYAEVVDWGIQSTSNKIAWVEIKEVERSDKGIQGEAQINPISKMAWQYAKANLPHLVYPGSDMKRQAKLADLLFFAPELYKMIKGYEVTCHNFKRGKVFNTSKSWIRLVNPEAKKIGGGYRVKMVRLIDSWSSLTNNAPSEEDATLGQIYCYEKEDAETGRMISSGVASYEPLIGGDENPYRYPLSNENSFTPLNIKQFDKNFGESIFASASVGYSKVTIRNLKPIDLGIQNEEITRHGTGYTEQEFYTAKEFPVITHKTTLDPDIKRRRLLKLIGFSFERASATQGFSIEMNDMHGKLKSQFTYDEYGNRQSGVEYFFKVEDETATTFRLSNKATVLKKNKTVEEDATIGVEMELLIDPQQKQEKSHSGAFASNMNGISLGIIPFIPVLTFFASYSYHETKVRTVTTTKIINRYALLDRVVAYDQDAKITTRNIAWDEETGEVLLTQTDNEYSDNIYNLTYPAHWAYDGMGQAYKNIGLKFSLTTAEGSNIINGKAAVSNDLKALLHPGDELKVESTTSGLSTPAVLWVLGKTTVSNDITFIQRDGSKAPDGDYTLKIIRSGRRNMQSTPVGSVVSKDNPLNIGSLSFGDKAHFSSVINASAVEFSSQWQTYSFDPGCWISDCSSGFDIFPNPNRDCSLYNGSNGYDIRSLYEQLFQNNTIVPPNIPTHKVFPNQRVLYPKEGQIINPYVWGVRGNWRPEKSYVYFDRNDNTNARTQTLVSNDLNTTNTKNDGVINNFEPFWIGSSGDDWVPTSTGRPDPWTWNTEVTEVSPDGNGAENVDALGIYSAAQYSFINKLPVAVANNARLNDIVFENFEDYGNISSSYFGCTSPPISTQPDTIIIKDSVAMMQVASSPMHWYLWPELKVQGDGPYTRVTPNVSHTGYRSLEILGDVVNVPVYTNPTNTVYNNQLLLSEYKAEKKDFVSVFEPTVTTAQNEYIVSYWKRAIDINLGDFQIFIPATATILPLTQIGTDNRVEDWVRREFKFTIPTNTTYFEVRMINNSIDPAEVVFFDDIRIFPIKSNMKGFVYDNTNRRLMAELDENNYATLYEYDAEGNLIRTKKETERGIITLSENRGSIKK